MVMDREVSGSNPVGVKVFCTHKEKLSWTKDHELNSLACRSRAFLPTFVGLCFDSRSRQVEVGLGLSKIILVICFIFDSTGKIRVLLLVP